MPASNEVRVRLAGQGRARRDGRRLEGSRFADLEQQAELRAARYLQTPWI